MLVVRNLNYKNILRNITFKIGKSGFVAILGPNGSGKTTLLKCLANIFRDYKGDIFILGKNLKKINKRKFPN